jgi:hypothetical protein
MPSISELKSIFAIDDNGKVVILGKIDHSIGNGIDRTLYANNILMAESMLREIRRNKKLLLPIDNEGGLFELDCTSGLEKVAEALYKANTRMQLDRSLDYSIRDVYLDIINQMMKVDAEFSRAIFENEIRPYANSKGREFARYMIKSSEIEFDNLSDSLIELNSKNVIMLSGLKFDESFTHLDPDYVVDVVLSSISIAELQGDRVRSTGLNAIAEYLLIMFPKKIAPYWERISRHIDNDFSVRNAFLLSKASDETLEKMLALEEETNNRLNFCHSPIFIFEAQKRGMMKKMKMTWVRSVMMGMTRFLPAWPKFYEKELKEVFSAMLSSKEITGITPEEIFITIGNKFSNSDVSKKAWNLLSDTIYDGLSASYELNGISREYFHEYYRKKYDNERRSKSHSVGSFLVERDLKYIRSGTIDSPIGRFFMMLSVLSDQTGGEALFKEAIKSGFRAFLTSKPSERKNFTRILSLMIHKNKFNDILETNDKSLDKNKMTPIGDQFIKTFFKELNNSNLRSVVVEKIVDVPTEDMLGHNGWRFTRDVDGGLLFGRKASDVAEIIKDIGARSIITTTILKIALQ